MYIVELHNQHVVETVVSAPKRGVWDAFEDAVRKAECVEGFLGDKRDISSFYSAAPGLLIAAKQHHERAKSEVLPRASSCFVGGYGVTVHKVA